MNEEWKDIQGYEGRYQVSTHGRVRSLRFTKPRIMKSPCNKRGYPHLELNYNMQKKTHCIHSLVAKAFISNPDNKPCVNHINGIKTDNSLGNLEWCTPIENNQHAWDNGLMENVRISKMGSNNALNKLTPDDVKFIFQYPRLRGSGRYLAEKFNVKHTNISSIRTGKHWKHVTLLL